VVQTVGLGVEKRHAERLKRLGYRRHPQGAGWVRPVKRAWFPRFHLHETVDWGSKQITLDLHLDHEREHPDARSPTASADSAVVAAEMARIVAAFSG
jgi:hypothetical protein